MENVFILLISTLAIGIGSFQYGKASGIKQSKQEQESAIRKAEIKIQQEYLDKLSNYVSQWEKAQREQDINMAKLRDLVDGK